MTKLETINAEDLQNRTYEPTHFLVDELIPEGLHILAGAPKIGKSWLALWLCLCVAQGQPLWNFATTQGEVLYLSLEDSFQRIQTRLFDLTEDAPPTLHFAIMADTLKRGLEQQIEQFLMEHSTTKLVVIDTLQRVRGTGSDSNLYANDYQDIGLLKKLADKQHIAILLIHHLRKLHDDDPMNMISGSTGLSGAADSAFVLQKHSRLANVASLHCTGRDIPDRTLKLEFGEEDHVWKLLEDSKPCGGASKISTLQLVHLFSELLRADPTYLGSPSALSAKIDPDGSLGITPKKVTRLVRESVAALRGNGILADTYPKLLPAERRAYDKILSFLVFLDSIQTANLPNISAYVTANEVNLCLNIQTFQECVHSQSYSYMLDSICSPVERNEILYQWKEDPHLLRRNTFIGDCYNAFQKDQSATTLLRVLMANYILEGIYFYSGFMFFYNLSRNGKMPGSAQEIRYINRDENTHLWLFRKMLLELQEEEPELFSEKAVAGLRLMMMEGVAQEIAWGHYVIGDEVPGLNRQMVSDYIQYLGNLRWTSLGYEPLYPGLEREPEGMEWVSQYANANLVKTDFFEARSTAYAKSTALIDDL